LHTPKIAEAVLTALLTPSFTRLVEEVAHETESGLVISNTENIQWLKPLLNSPRNEWKKPDFVVTHPSVLMLIPREQSGGDGIIKFRNLREDWQETKCFFGGVDMNEHSIGLIASLWEGKCELGNMNEALGEMVDYIRCYVVVKSMISFILYDKLGFVGGFAKTGTMTQLMVHPAYSEGRDPAVIPWCLRESNEQERACWEQSFHWSWQRSLVGMSVTHGATSLAPSVTWHLARKSALWTLASEKFLPPTMITSFRSLFVSLPETAPSSQSTRSIQSSDGTSAVDPPSQDLSVGQFM
jgi:hypothetical protein